MEVFQELGLLLVLVAVAILTYSSLAYFAEREAQVVNFDKSSVYPNVLLCFTANPPNATLVVPGLCELHGLGWGLHEQESEHDEPPLLLLDFH